MTTRQLQLRVWDKKQDRFVPFHCLSQLTDDGLIVTQCTGVRDYFDRLIYEGDILKWANYDEREGMYSESHYEVAFLHGCFGTFGLKGVDGETDLSEFQSPVSGDAVVGNVFENAWLLGQHLELQWP